MQMILERGSGSKSRLLRAPKTIHPCSIRIRPLSPLTAEPPRALSFSARRPIDTVAAAQPSAQLQRSNALAGLREDGNEVMVPLIHANVSVISRASSPAHTARRPMRALRRVRCYVFFPAWMTSASAFAFDPPVTVSWRDGPSTPWVRSATVADIMTTRLARAMQIRHGCWFRRWGGTCYLLRSAGRLSTQR